jgi:CubicO group peptidase (beta-lactamase class C family)
VKGVMTIGKSIRAVAAATAFAMGVWTSAWGQDAAGKNAIAAEKLKKVEEVAVAIPQGDGKPALTFSLAGLMENFKVPGLSLAIVENYQIVAAKGYGAIGPESKTAVTTRTLFQAGSISKPVTAAAALWMVEHGQLSLDTNVNDALKSWKVPDNEFTAKQKVTLRRLMSHTAGTNVHGFPGYDVDAKIPTVVQVLNGEKPANTPAVRVEMVPGTKYQYSGGGVTIEQLLMTEVSGKPFPALLRETVLDKIGMNDSSYEQPLPAARASMTAAGTYADGRPVHGRWHVYPEMAAAGLWTTPTDLANFAIEIANSKDGKSNKILSQKMTTEMLTPVLGEAGLGFFMDLKNPGQFGHGGADEGFQAILTMNYETGNGVVVMTDSDHGIFVAGEVVRAVAKDFGWKYRSGEDVMSEIFLLATGSGAAAALERYGAIKQANSPDAQVDEGTLNLIGYLLLNNGRTSDAIAVLARNVKEYPESGNVYDSLGEAYMRDGQKELAIENYGRSLAIDPKNMNAVAMLKKLREMK